MKIVIIVLVIVGVILAIAFIRGAKKNDNVEIFKKEPPKGF